MNSSFQTFWNKKWSNILCNIGPTQFGLKTQKYLQSNKKILDIGCGSGRDTYLFSELGLQVTAVDFSQQALENIQGKNIQTVCGDTLSYDFQENTYDYIYACNSLHYFSLEDFQQVVNRIYLALKDGGFFFLRVKSIDDKDFGKGKKLAENYYKNGGDYKYYFSQEVLEKYLGNFEIIVNESVTSEHNKIGGGVSRNGFLVGLFKLII